MAIRMTGLTSGLDTESIIEALVSAQKMKTTKVQNKLTKSEWSEEIWKDMNKKLYSFYTKELTKFKTQGSYLTKKASSSNESVATATATNGAVAGSHSLAVKSLASSQMVTGSVIDANSTVKSLADLGMDVGTVIDIKGANGKSSKLEVTATTTIADFLSSCKSAGLNASFDTNQKRLFISSKESGEANAFSITTKKSDRYEADREINTLLEGACDESLYTDYISAADTIKEKLRAGVEAGKAPDMNNAAIDIMNCVRGYYSDAKVTDTLNTYGVTLDEYNEFKSKFNATLAYDEEDKLNDIMSDYLADYATASEVKTNFDAIAANNDTLLFSSELKNEYKKLQSLDETSYANLKTLTEASTDDELSAAGVTRDQVKAYALLKGTPGVDIDKFDELMERYIKNESKDSTSNPLKNIGLGEIEAGVISGNAGASIKAASDAVIVLDGAELSGTSNSFSVNGMTLNLTSTTENQNGGFDEIMITVNNDTKAAYDMVKDFVKKYNELLEEMNTKYSAKSARDYDPLTDEQKEAMTDDEVEKWETKIKDSLLRRDDTLNGIISTMRSSLQLTVDVDGKKYSLASFGIKTSTDYTEKGKLHIFGDEDDDTYSSETNKLMDALENNPDAVMKTLAEAGQKLYDSLTKKMSKTSLSSALTFYNDKQMDDAQAEYKKKIQEMEKKLTQLEDKYYKQFSAMETALTKMQNSASSVTSFFGY